MDNSKYILEMKDITKTFPGVVALDRVQLCVKKGTVHGVVGENGAGKSTLMKILQGIYKQDSGSIIFKGEERHFKSPNDALRSGIAMIHQELSSVLDLTVAENIFLGKELLYDKLPILNKKDMIKKTEELFEELSINIDPRVKMKHLSMSNRQMCEIAKAVSYNSDLIIMDEPTSAITENEVKQLFEIIERLLKRGITVIYISHKMDEIFTITDYISIYRDGQYIKTVETEKVDQNMLIEMMVGREIKQLFPKAEAKIGEEIFRVEGLSDGNKIKDINFNLKSGEILGVSGLMGSGRSEIMELIFGIRRKRRGEFYIYGKKVNIENPRDAIKNGIAFLTEDRKESGCFLSLSVCINICISAMQKIKNGILIKREKNLKEANRMKDLLDIRATSVDQKIMYLSGGNQQKALIGRWLLSEPNILIVDEPTRGIDVSAKSEIHRLLSKLAQEGKAIIMISSELPEILGMSDRIMVVSEGRIAGFLDAEEASQEKILMYATGAMEKE